MEVLDLRIRTGSHAKLAPSLSSSAKQLVRNLLSLAPSTRPTAHDLTSSGWLEQQAAASDSLPAVDRRRAPSPDPPGDGRAAVTPSGVRPSLLPYLAPSPGVHAAAAARATAAHAAETRRREPRPNPNRPPWEHSPKPVRAGGFSGRRRMEVRDVNSGRCASHAAGGDGAERRDRLGVRDLRSLEQGRRGGDGQGARARAMYVEGA